MELRPYQNEAKEAVLSEWEQGHKKTLLVLPTGCHAKGQRLLMADGRSERVENIKLGDRLIGADSKPRTVLHINTGTGSLYLIKPVKGKPFIVTEDHKLTLVRTAEKKNVAYPYQKKRDEIIDVTVKEWLAWTNNKKHLYKLFRAGEIDFPDASRIKPPIDPYSLGIILGRGEHSGCKRSELHKQLKEIGLNGLEADDKYIPQIYKTLDVKQRLEVIAGLVDADGYEKCKGYDFISKSWRLAEDLAFMCRSVGLAAYIKQYTKTISNLIFKDTYYRVLISGDCDKIPCRVYKKKSGKREQKKNALRTGFTVEKIGKGEYYGFTVDGDNRYLLDDFTVTHNCGKTIVFAKIAEHCVNQGKRVLILAHRGELLEQAADKILKTTGLRSALEKAESSCLNSWYRIAVGSVQSLMREKRLNKFSKDYFDTIIIDEAHHCISDSYQKILNYFENADVLGVTATPDRGDMKNLGEVFESLAYEYTLPKAIKEGYLSPIKAMTIPLKLDISGVGIQTGDYKTSDLDSALDPYLYQIAEEMQKVCKDKKTVVFLPLVKTSQKFRDILNSFGFRAAEVNGESKDRAQVLNDFDNGEYNVLCNSMLLTEGWDCPSVDCIVILRPTKVRSLYSQMVGRGTRLAQGKEYLLLLDFLWQTEKHELCRPACLICDKEEIAQKMTKAIEEAGGPVDIEEAEEKAESDAIAQREESLAKALKEMRKRKRKLVDPLQFEMSIQAEDLAGYVPAFGWEMSPPSEKQKQTLEKLGIFPDEIENAGKASMLLDRLDKRKRMGLTTPKQIRLLERYGFKHVGTWQFDDASNMISRIAAQGWRTVPFGVDPETYMP